jgi:hypothetical protein
MVVESGPSARVLGPTLMFGWFDRKHLDWLELLSAKKWIEAWCGERIYAKLWEPLFHLKYIKLADNISVAWIWTSIKGISSSLHSLMQEKLGYIDGGAALLAEAFGVPKLRRRPGRQPGRTSPLRAAHLSPGFGPAIPPLKTLPAFRLPRRVPIALRIAGFWRASALARWGQAIEAPR